MIYLLLLIAAPRAPQVQAPAPEALFVQAFYDWYTPLALTDSKNPAWYLALTNRAASLDSELVHELRADSAAQASATDGAVGLDFDPFLNTQDPDEHYVVGRTTHHRQHSFVEVFSVRSGKRGSSPTVIVELTRAGDSWVFVNIHYPAATTDLLKVLRTLRTNSK